jgi:acyl carrier protein
VYGQNAESGNTGSVPRPSSSEVADGVLEALRTASRRPIEPTLESDLVADLGFDSLQLLDVIAELEGRFDIVIPLDEVPSTRKVAQVVGQVARLLEAREKEAREKNGPVADTP